MTLRTEVPPCRGIVLVNAQLSGTVDLTSVKTDLNPVNGGPAGSLSFEAEICNISPNTVTPLKSVTTTLTGGNGLLNRDSGTPAGVGSALTFPANEGFAERVLDTGECVRVPYQISLADGLPFDFFVDVVGGTSAPAATARSMVQSMRVTADRKGGNQPSRSIGLVLGGGR